MFDSLKSRKDLSENLGLDPIRIVPGFSNSLDPDSAKYLDPDSVNPDSKHCL
jgi:hypothetical protein